MTVVVADYFRCALCAEIDNSEFSRLYSLLSARRSTLGVPDTYKTVRGTPPGEKVMKVAQFIVAAAIAIPAVSSFAQSTPLSMNDDVRAQIAQEKMTYRYADVADQTQAAVNDGKRAWVPPRQITEVNMGRFSLSVVRPSF